MIQWMLAILSLVPLPFLNPACISGNSQFTYCWSLAWWMLNITLLACEMHTDVQLDLEKQRNQRSYGLHSLDHREGNGISEKHLLLFHIEYVKAFDYVYHATNWKPFKEMGIPDHLIVSWETCMRVKKQQREPDVEQLVLNWERSMTRLYIVTLFF